MNYAEWKQKYLELLIALIKKHPYSEKYNNDFINELANELLERAGFDEDSGYWEETLPKEAVNESYQLWLTDYFEDKYEAIQINR